MKCDVPFCRTEEEMRYYGHPLCLKHWEQHCDDKINLKITFQIQ